MSARRSLLRLPLTGNHRCLRRHWCDERRTWTTEWNDIVFSDEYRFCLQHHDGGCDHDSLVVKVSDLGWHVTSSSPVPLKTCRVGERCTLNLSRARTSSRWCGVVVWRGDADLGVTLVT
ncbi:transposable element Tc3 transposase [Trichonephila clavipes]|nr:transposable element Tc3 transposase [Trichonephila clavipes]